MNELEKLVAAIENAIVDENEKPFFTYNTFSDSEKKKLVEFCHEGPEKFLKETSSKISEMFKTKDSLDVSTFTSLSKDIWEKFISIKQTDQQFINKLLLWKSLNSFIKSDLSECGLFMAGSTLNGFGLQVSDMDLSLVTTEKVDNSKDTCMNYLKKLVTLLKKNDNIGSIEIIEAKVPLIKFHERKYDFWIDINFNITSNIQNTHLLYCYSQVDWRVSPLVTIIKQWAKTNELLDAKYGSLSSYPLGLMVIHFLQAGVKPKILPSLQKCLKEKFDSAVKCIDYFNPIEVPFTELYPANKQSLGELLLQFFEYYEKFEFNQYVISIREAEKISKSEYYDKYKHTNQYMNEFQRGFMFIEEPFNLSNVGQTVFKLTTFVNIKSTFEKTYLRLKTTRNLSDIMYKS